MVREGPPRLAPVLVPEGPSEKIHSWERIEAQRLSAGGTAEVLPLDTNPSDPKATFTQSLRGWVDAGAVFHMRLNDYHFITHWRVRATVEEVSEILEHAEDLPRWWPSVYLDVKEIEPGVTGGIGKIVSLYTKGWLPYTLRWKFRVTDSNKPYGFALEAFGDFQGRGIWKFEQQGEWVDVEYDWKIRADKPLLRALSFALKPIFEANHRWAMARGEESLSLELARRRAPTAEQAALIPKPPRPTFPHNLRRVAQPLSAHETGRTGAGSLDHPH